MLVHLLATEATAVPTGITAQAEHLLQEFAFFLKILLEFIAIVTIAIALVKSLQKFFYYRRRHQSWMFQSSVRLELGLSLSLALEFLLAADIVWTAISPGWQEIAQLAAITGIRTFLNFFLHQEVQELQEISAASSPHKAVEPQEFDSE